MKTSAKKAVILAQSKEGANKQARKNGDPQKPVRKPMPNPKEVKTSLPKNGQISLFDIDTLIKEIDSIQPKDTAQRIIDETHYSYKRAMITDWMIEQDVKIVIAFSGGKDSIAMALYLAFELKIPTERIELWHHEIDGKGENLFDWACTTSYCQAFADAFGFDLLFSYRKGGLEREMYRTHETSQSVFFQQEVGGEYKEAPSQQKKKFLSTRRKFPAVHKDLNLRWCSAKGKYVMARAISNSDRFTDCQLLICTGERRAESDKRSAYNEIQSYTGMSATRRALVWRPIIDWSDSEVWAILEKYKVQPHPCYMLGWSRCSCQCCIFNDEHTFATMLEISPEKIDRLERIEQDFSFTMFNDMSVRFKAHTGNSFLRKSFEDDLPVLAYWVNQAVGEFNAPIIVENWKMPAGAYSLNQAGAV